MGRSWVLSQVAKRLRHELAYEHSLVKSEPARERSVERKVDWISWPSGILRLKTCPCRVEGLKTSIPVVDSSKAIAIQILEQESLLEVKQRPGDTSSGDKNFRSPENTKAESVQRSRPNSVCTS